VPDPFEAVRYHSLLVEKESLPDCLEITAESDQGEIMGLRHRECCVEGIQFHPESIMTAVGKDLLRNFLAM
jgi:anthranilate/para-aminobenzoate synthase component II